jgi:hypothetical protein
MYASGVCKFAVAGNQQAQTQILYGILPDIEQQRKLIPIALSLVMTCSGCLLNGLK